MKTDQEPAIKLLVDDICANRTGARAIAEMPPKGSKGSNGAIERAVRAVEECLRAAKSSLGERLNTRVETEHPMLAWLVSFVSYMMNLWEVSSDGKTAYELVKGKRVEVLGLEVGEELLLKYHPGGIMANINARRGHGVYLGVWEKSGELVVADEETKDIKYTRTVKRVPEEMRWSPGSFEWVARVPWNRGRREERTWAIIDGAGEAGHFYP